MQIITFDRPEQNSSLRVVASYKFVKRQASDTIEN